MLLLLLRSLWWSPVAVVAAEKSVVESVAAVAAAATVRYRLVACYRSVAHHQFVAKTAIVRLGIVPHRLGVGEL